MRRAWFIRRAVCVALLAGGASQIQAADSDSTAHRVRIVQAGEILRDPSVPGAQRLIGEVVLAHRDATLRCDSAWRFDDGRFSAMGNVRAERSGSWYMTAQQLLWDPTSERFDAFGNPAKLVEGSLSVTGPSLQYDWSRERATFSQRSHLSTPERQADANRGRYDSDTGWLTLGGQVTVEGEVERVESDSLKVHAREGGLQLLGPSRIAHRSGEWDIRCERGEIASDSGWVASEAVRAAWRSWRPHRRTRPEARLRERPP